MTEHLTGAYALDALDDIERATFERHLRGCSACQVEVHELHETVARLADQTATAPPPALRTNVLAQISRTRQDRPMRAAGPGAGSGRAGRGAWRVRLVAAAAAVVVATGAAAGAWVVSERQYDELQVSAEAERRRIADVLAAPDAVIRAKEVDGGGRVVLVVSPSMNAAVAVASGLQAPGADRVYQLWLVRNAQPESVGVLAVGASGGTVLIEKPMGAEAFAVSVEKAPQAPKPSPPVAQVPLT